jgi:putative transposase
MLNYDNTKAITSINYHFAWHTIWRTAVLTGDIRARLNLLLIDKCNDDGIEILCGRIGKSYVHMALSCPPKLSPSVIIQGLKGSSSKYLRDIFPQLKQGVFTESLWETGYLCASFGDVSDEDIERYLGNL